MYRVRFVNVAISACLLAIGLPGIVSAQSGLAGLVTDATGGVLPGVTVEAASPLSSREVGLSSRTNKGGIQSSTCGPASTALRSR